MCSYARTMRLQTWLVTCSLLLAACAAPQSAGRKDIVRNDSTDTGSSEDDLTATEDSDDQGEGDETTERAAGEPKAKTFVGTLEATPLVEFGGDPYCKYNVTLKAVELKVGTSAAGEIETATVKDVVVEQAIQCPHGPMSPAKQAFDLKTSTKTENGWTIEFKGSAENKPETALVVDIVKNGDDFDAALSWTRTDQKAPLAWKVSANVPLAANIE